MAVDLTPKNKVYENINTREHNLYNEEFFGGSDVYIYIDGQRFHDISAIQFSINEQQKPIYGYSSRTFDDIATGVRIVQGAFRIPIRNASGSDSLINKTVNDGEYGVMGTRSSDISPANVPSWVYGVEPSSDTVEDTSSYTVDYTKREIPLAQEKLREAGYEVDITGIKDIKTRIALNDYKSKNGLAINDNIDNEVLNMLGVNDNSSVKLLSDTGLRYSPEDNSLSYCNVKANTSCEIIDQLNDWYLIKTSDGSKGYVKKGAVAL